MRKIEREMLFAINNKGNWSKANTSVKRCKDGYLGDAMRVELHGNHIATISDTGRIKISDAGWQSNTTKSRLNAILTELKGYAYGISQRKFEWFLSDKNGESDMYSNTWYEIDALNIGV
tara:strand:+ start:3182 stop:3538 length:357 start_codon:yes stop_codon:yes gene_type:complete